MYRVLPIALVALSAIAAPLAPANAQTASEQRRMDDAQRRYDNETALYQRERAYYDQAVRRDQRSGYYNQSYNAPPPAYNPAYDTRYATDYDASRYYRDDPRYQERVLTSNDQVYRGSDGRYYCKRSDGTTGLIIGAAAGGILGNVVYGGRNRIGGTLIGGALGALLGKKAEQSNDQYRCR
ncbi:MAG: glycine zipper 2TM domain-containing protein [Sphingomonas sp.]|uniref:glycine zipper 2TM domain-containing protein n=1 Tax=Sphingomonas sp. TaxID=28214 RepID=UPI001AC151F2|nr:glycine zipper 2TM domain-containing protein [Sphingomonas sp.]MBN8807012.1 glycine zipper 2TM domain-containing protein [Sphingomonas sp.]